MPKLSSEEAGRAIRRILAHPLGRMVPAWGHLGRRGRERDFGMQDVECVLSGFEVVSTPAWDKTHQNWTCKVRGLDAEREELVLVVGICEPELRVVVITGY